MPLVIARHGRTEANANRLLQGRLDLSLDEHGLIQASAIAAALRPLGSEPVRVLASPLRRTVETADAIVGRRTGGDAGDGGGVVGGACGVDPVVTDTTGVTVDERWIELDYGEFDGLPVGEVPPDVWAAWSSDPDFAPPGGESMREMTERVHAALDELWPTIVDTPDVTTVVVSHVSPIKATLGWALGLGVEAQWRSFVAPGALLRIGVGRGGRPSLHSFNEQPPLG